MSLREILLSAFSLASALLLLFAIAGMGLVLMLFAALQTAH